MHLETQRHKYEAWLCFSSKLEKCMKSCVSLLFYGSKLWRCWNSYSNLPGSLSGAHWPTCVCVFVHTAASSDCNVGGMVAWWLVLSHPKTFFSSGIPQKSRWRPKLFISNTEIHQSKQHAYWGLFKKRKQEKVKFITDFYCVHIVIAVIFRD